MPLRLTLEGLAQQHGVPRPWVNPWCRVWRAAHHRPPEAYAFKSRSARTHRGL